MARTLRALSQRMNAHERTWKHAGALACGLWLAACFLPCALRAQQPAADAKLPPAPAGVSPQPDVSTPLGAINGTAADAQDEVIDGASVILEGPDPASRRETKTNDNGFFQFTGLKPGAGYRLILRANGFADWSSQPITLAPGQVETVAAIRMMLEGGPSSVTVSASPAVLATEQVHIAEQQRILGIFPNYYVTYDASAPPLTAKTKLQLAARVSIDPVTIAGIFFTAGIDQAARIPSYPLGAKGYAERVGAGTADEFTDTFFASAIFPALLRQDPRYFYQGTGSIRSRLEHALAFAFVCRGDNGRNEPNYSTVGGDMSSAALSTLYYPQSDQNWSFWGESVGIDTLGREINALMQEFVLRHFTTGPKGRKTRD